jgi:hypothetical protein
MPPTSRSRPTAARKSTSKSKAATVERRPTTARTLTPGTQARLAAMNATTPIVTQEEITNVLAELALGVSRASVGHVIHGRFWNADVARVFCALTGTTLPAAWPEFVDERGGRRPSPAAEAADNARWHKASKALKASGVRLRP